MVWSTGLQNPGIDGLHRDELPRLARGGAHVIVSIGGGALEDFVRLTGVLQGRPEVAAIETYLAGPDEELRRESTRRAPDRAAEIVGAVARMSTVPVFAKAAPERAGRRGDSGAPSCAPGARGITVGGPPPALVVDAARLRPGARRRHRLALRTGREALDAARGLRGRARGSRHASSIACGGIRSGEDAVEAILAGAWAVQVGTAALVDPEAPVTVAQGIVRYLKGKGLGSPADVRGRLRVPASFGARRRPTPPGAPGDDPPPGEPA